MTKNQDRSEQYVRQVADELMEQIKEGVAPWQKPWKPGEKCIPENLATGKPYTGGNSIYLMSRGIRQGHGDNRWGTYKQIEAAGGHVRKGERGTKVLFYTDRARITAKDEAGKPLKDKDGKPVYEEAQRNHPVVRQYTVFNAEQADGLKLPERETKSQPEWKAHENAEAVMRGSGVRINHVAGDRAYYNLQTDKVTLPERGQFPTPVAYYQTALHELGHATGHPDRMNRKSLQEGVAAGYGSEAYAREELRAEISAMMTGQKVGVGHDGSRGAAYVENWLEVLKKEPREIYHAASEAQKISDHLTQPMRERSAEAEKKQGELSQKYSHEAGPQISHAPSPQAKEPPQQLEREVSPNR